MPRRFRSAELTEPFAAREELERRWFRRTRPMPELAELVTGEQLALEPFHRWMPYQQAFAPKLVRLFLAHAEDLSSDPDAAILDPFSGSGTTAIECARQQRRAIGVEAIACLAFLAGARGAPGFPSPPDLRGCANWQECADRLLEDVHRAGLILAVARQHNSDGKPLRQAPPLRELIRDVFALQAEDLTQPLPMPIDVRPGDARDLAGLPDGGVAGVLTSPPYLSRHDYTRITRPHETVYAHWHPGAGLAGQRSGQVRAHPRAHGQLWRREPLPAVEECVAALQLFEHPREAGVVRSYFEDMASAMRELARVARPGAPLWVVLGGARVEGVYVPADLIVADLAEAAGLEVRSIRVARRLTRTGRKLGTLVDVAPRESVLLLRAAGA